MTDPNTHYHRKSSNTSSAEGSPAQTDSISYRDSRDSESAAAVARSNDTIIEIQTHCDLDAAGDKSEVRSTVSKPRLTWNTEEGDHADSDLERQYHLLQEEKQQRRSQNRESKRARKKEMLQKTQQHVKGGMKKTGKSIKQIVKEFFRFLGDGRIMDYAIGMVIGTAFTTVINSLVADLISPFIGMAIGTQLENFYVVLKKPPMNEICSDALYANTTMNATIAALCTFNTPNEAHSLGVVTWNLGSFAQTLLNFFMVSLSVFAAIKSLKGVLGATRQHLKNLKTAPHHISQSLQNIGTAFKKGSSHPQRTSSNSRKSGTSRTDKTPRVHAPPALNATVIAPPALETHVEHVVTVLPAKPSNHQDTTAAKVGEPVQSHHTSEATTVVSTTLPAPGFLPSHNRNATVTANCDLKECPFCFNWIPARATRCGFCTSEIECTGKKKDKNKGGDWGGGGHAKDSGFNMQFGKDFPINIK
ncbi:hypothetical protein HDU78_004579 [Chytriomyces hyalinus]|nr:hypothetical protein HDU78_004579 [Chytriomyces hyalinus]